MSQPRQPSKFEIYIYDTKLLQREEDDPLEAFLYHYPRSIGSNHILLMACQLAGMAQFFKNATGEEIKFISLKQGRFEVERIGRFYLFIGDMSVLCSMDERSVSTERLRNLVISTIELFHGSLQTWFDESVQEEAFRTDLISFMDALFEPSGLTTTMLTVSAPATQASPKYRERNFSLKRIQDAGKENPKIVGSMVTVEGDVVFSTFPSEIATALKMLSPNIYKMLRRSETDFRLPLGIELFALNASQTWSDRIRKHIQEKKLMLIENKSIFNEGEEEEGEEFSILGPESIAELTNSIRKICFVNESEKGSENEKATFNLVRHTFGSLELITGIFTNKITEDLIRNIWSLGLLNVPCLFPYWQH